MLNYHIISSDSQGGNSVKIGDIIVDAGISYKELEPWLYGVKYILITHQHCDHYKIGTLHRIKQEHPEILLIGNYEVATHERDLSLFGTPNQKRSHHEEYLFDRITRSGYPVDMIDQIIIPYDVPHNVKVNAYDWYDKNGNHIFYMTDCLDSSVLDEYIPARNRYDYMFLEANHDADKLEQVRNQHTSYDVFGGGMRHLSKQHAKEFYYEHRVNVDSPWIRLHKSARFY